MDYPLFYNAIDDDRVYDADSFSDWLKKFFTTGVFKDELRVTASGGMVISVASGYCNINGKVMMFDTTPLTVGTADSQYYRIDSVIAERNDTQRNFILKIVQGNTGTESSVTGVTPVRSGGVYQLVLARIKVKPGATSITQADIKNAFIKIGIGTEKKSHVISEKEKRITAFHETGHAILFHELPDVGDVYTISVIPTGNGAGGYTMPLPDRDQMYYTRGRMLQEIMVSLGGRIAEELVLDDITTGASQDIKQATNIARQMVTRYGMSSAIGTINYEQGGEDVFLGYDIGHEKRNSEYVAGEIDKEVRAIIEDCYAKAKKIISDHKDVLYSCADLLMEKEKITGEEFDRLFHTEPAEQISPDPSTV